MTSGVTGVINDRECTFRPQEHFDVGVSYLGATHVLRHSIIIVAISRPPTHLPPSEDYISSQNDYLVPSMPQPWSGPG
eukprot:scaffold1794_cov107-Cylindrotheca_fusiformis.AAC.3